MLTLLIPLSICVFLIVYASSLVIESIIQFSRKTGVSVMFVTFVSLTLGNVLPEFITSTFTTVYDMKEVSVLNILTNIVFDLTIVLGLGLLLLKSNKNNNYIDVEDKYIYITGILLLLFLFFTLDGSLNYLEGLFLFALYPIIFLLLLKYNIATYKQKVVEIPIKEVLQYLFIIPLGIAMIIVNAFILIQIIKILLVFYGFPEYVIGYLLGVLTITPEIIVTIVSAMKKEIKIMIANLLGTVIVDFTFVMGVPASITNLPIINPYIIWYSIIILLLSLFILKIVKNKKQLSKIAGIVYILLFIIYSIVYLI